MNTPLTTEVQALLASATADEALLCASMSLQMALIRTKGRGAPAKRKVMREALTMLPHPDKPKTGDR